VTIGLICAIPQELAHLRAALIDAHSEEAAHTVFDTGTIDGHDVVLAGSGMGKVNAALVTTLLADRFGCRTVVFSGVAGGLDPTLSIGDVVIADLVIQHDAGMLEDQRLRTYQPGYVPIINPTDRLGYPADPELLASVKGRLAGISVPGQIVYGTVLSGDHYLNCETTRDRLVRELGGQAIEWRVAPSRKCARRSASHGWSSARCRT
jgi:adenosylhomocysteine nucleosidase